MFRVAGLTSLAHFAPGAAAVPSLSSDGLRR
jgi:hypothetical protein